MSDHNPSASEPATPEPATPEPATPEPATPEPATPKPPKSRTDWRKFARNPVATGVVGLIIGMAIGAGSATTSSDQASAGSPQPGPTATVTVDAAPEEEEEPVSAPADRGPRPRDFNLRIIELEKECFGSAGGLITYRVRVAYNGPPLDPFTDYEVLYVVRGGEDGPIRGRFTVSGNEYSTDSENTVGTSTCGQRLAAEVVEVL